MAKMCYVYGLGLVDYRVGLWLQESLLDSRKTGAISDVLLLMQHPPVFTMGRRANEKNIVVPRETLLEEGISVFHTNRGGDVTYHGPGQLVCYPILHLWENGLNSHQYVWNLEEVVIRTLSDFGIYGQRVSEKRGVWVGEEKICSLGLQVRGHVSMHGFALNVNTDLKYFAYIIPCGIEGVVITSVAKLLGYEVEIDGIKKSLLSHFSQVFKLNLEYGGSLEECLVPPNQSGSERLSLTRQS